MKPVNFPVDEAIHKKFKIICGMNDVNMGEALAELMQKYVKENEDLVSSPQIQGKLPPEIPSFYGDQGDWRKYVNGTKKLEIENFATRIAFLRYLLHSYLIDEDNDSEIYNTISHSEYFKESKDYKFLVKHRIIYTIRTMGEEKNLSTIGII
ncbi:hypothetical protein JYT57_01210 [Nitrosarchaeum koreense]|nr:hypothetical protein [Nitrosarchaeum koreense]